MIEKVLSNDGSSVIRVDGRLMASRFDPRAEARAWFESRRAFVARVRTVFVLGLGAGYHVAEVLKHTEARVVVLEPRADVAAALPIELDSSRVSIQVVDSVGALRANEVVRTALKKSYVTLVHPASRAMDVERYRALAAQLTGRDWGALNWIWSLKGHAGLNGAAPDLAGLRDLSAAALGEATIEAAAGAAPLTIYDLAQTELVQNSSERERLLIKALRELVK